MYNRVKVLADRYARMAGLTPPEEITPDALSYRLSKSKDGLEEITIPLADYKKLLDLACEFDDVIVICETCGAWLETEDACTEDVTMCWKSATMDERWDHTCRSFRAIK